ncbi:hypothetical protein XF35_39145, partial [Streptomyces platensis subsp. clarensis]|nr:hypothetical protein [Streptomyces platensis subsp. clarensis]
MAHNLRIDPTTPEGEAIVTLFNLIQADEEEDGTWNAVDAVDTLCRWFRERGIDIDAGPIEPHATGPEPLIVSRFDIAMEPAPEEDPVLTIGAIADNAQPVALLFDREDRVKVAH